MKAIDAHGLIAVHADPAGPVAALRGLDLTVEVGELAAIVGPSGSGKTTLLRLLAGIERPTAGRLDVLGVPLATASEAALRRHRRDAIAIVEQHYRLSLSPYLSIRRSVGLPLALRGVGRTARDRRADELLERVGLRGRGHALPAELSGGEQQRVAVAAALATRPRLILADEPTGELDAETAGRLLALLRELVRETGSTAVVVTHDEAVEAIADRTVHVRDGRAIAERRGPVLAQLEDGLGWRAPAIRNGSTVGTDPAPHVLPEVPHLAGTPVASAGPAVRLVDVGRTYGGASTAVRAIEGVSFELARGGFHVVTGPSGAGKSTILRLIAGLDDPTGGTVETLGTSLADLDRDARARFRAERLGVVDQARGLTPFLSALENVALALTIHGRDATEARDRARTTLEQVGLGEVVDRRPATLSAGERTRVAIARALATEPDLLLLDEPTATLDRGNAAHIGELLAALAGPRTVIAATHDRALMDVATDRYSLR
jgi:peptide/nickel transport system ATP-binding protein